jgi:uncharacterized protein YceH (UPF0502 family)
MFELNVVEARVLGCLIEKEINTPEYYPLSLNATLNACNQKSSREPVMELVEPDVRTALFELSKMRLVRTSADGRVSTLERLAAREEPLVVLLNRQPGAREARWAHLLSGEVSDVASSLAPSQGVAKVSEGVMDRIATLEEFVRSLEVRLSALENPEADS